MNLNSRKLQEHLEVCLQHGMDQDSCVQSVVMNFGLLVIFEDWKSCDKWGVLNVCGLCEQARRHAFWDMHRNVDQYGVRKMVSGGNVNITRFIEDRNGWGSG